MFNAAVDAELVKFNFPVIVSPAFSTVVPPSVTVLLVEPKLTAIVPVVVIVPPVKPLPATMLVTVPLPDASFAGAH